MHPRTFRVGLPLLALSLAGAASAQQQPQPSTPPAGSNRPVQSPGNAKWADTLDQARARATADKQLVFIEFASPDCSDCRRMQSLLYPAFDFEALLIGMVPVQVRYDSEESKPLQQRYHISESPSVMITTPEGRLVFLMQGFKDARDFYAHARKDLDAYRQFVKKMDATNRATASAADALAIGKELYARTDVKAALPWLQRAAIAADPGPGIRETALEGVAAAQLELNDPAGSRKTIDVLIATAKNPDMKERAELFRAQLPLAEGNAVEALALYKKFVKDHPQSKYLDQVQSVIARLEAAGTP
jgi:thioredoxin-related protein